MSSASGEQRDEAAATPVTADAWIAAEIARERSSFERARRRFVRKPSEERLHDVRTTGRRLRSLLDDVAAVAPGPRLYRCVKKAARLTDRSRDAAVLIELFERVLDPAEIDAAEPLKRALHERERRATKSARRELERMRVASA